MRRGFDRSWTIWVPGNPGPSPVVPISLQLPGGEPELELTAWRSAWATAFGGSFDAAFVLFRGQLQSAEATQRLSQAGNADALMVVSFAPATIRIEPDLDAITVAVVGNPPNATGVTLRITERC